MPRYQGFKPAWKGGWNTGSTSNGVQLRAPTPVPERVPSPRSAPKTLDLSPSDYSRTSHSGTSEMRAQAARANHIRRMVQLGTVGRKIGWWALKGAFQMQPFSRTYKMLEFAAEMQPWTTIKPGDPGEHVGYDFSGFPWEGWKNESDWLDCRNNAIPWTGEGGTGGSTWTSTPGGICSGGYTHVNHWFGIGPPADLADLSLRWLTGSSGQLQWKYDAVEMGPANGREVFHRHAMKEKWVSANARNNTGVWEIPYPQGIRIPAIRVGVRSPVMTPLPYGIPFPGTSPRFSTPTRPRNRFQERPGETPATQTNIPRGRGRITRVATRHFHRLPPPRVRERKTKLNSGLLGNLWGGYSELMDWADAVNKAIPKKPCKSKNPFERFNCLADNWDKINWPKAAWNIIEMQVEDMVIGKFSRAAALGIGKAADHGYYNSPFGSEFGKGYWRNNLRVNVKEM